SAAAAAVHNTAKRGARAGCSSGRRARRQSRSQRRRAADASSTAAGRDAAARDADRLDDCADSRPARWDACQAAWNMRMISTTPQSDASAGATHSDLAFSGKYAIQGNYNGFEIWDISNPAKPVLANAYTCPASQNDISVFKNLLFMSSEATNSRQGCKFGGVPEPVSENRVRGIRIFDISDVARPKLVTSVQTCRGSHTHTVVTPPGDTANVY